MNRVTRSARATSNRCLESPEIVSLLFDTGLLIDAVACRAAATTLVSMRANRVVAAKHASHGTDRFIVNGALGS